MKTPKRVHVNIVSDLPRVYLERRLLPILKKKKEKKIIRRERDYMVVKNLNQRKEGRQACDGERQSGR